MTSRLVVAGELLLYGDVGIGMFGDGFTSRDVVDALAQMGSGDIAVRINSPGGAVFEGVAIYNALLAHPGTVTIYIDGLAASAASVIAMAGDEIVMRPGSSLMIHDPRSDMYAGTSDDHQAAADMLEQLAEQVAQIYASHTGIGVEEIRNLMGAETWLTAEDAVEQGFATALANASTEELANMADKTVTMSAVTADDDVTVAESVADAEQVVDETEEAETVEAISEDIAETVVAQSQKRVRMGLKPKPDVAMTIINRCVDARLTAEQTRDVVKGAGGSLLKAQQIIINTLAGLDPAPRGGVMPAVVVADSRDKFVTGAGLALMARAGIAGGERNEFAGMTLRELALESLRRNNIDRKFTDPMAMVAAAFNPQRMGFSISPRMEAGMHSTSDFTEILGNTANKAMLIGWEETEESFEAWTAKGTLSDFKAISRVDINLFPSLAEVPEGAEYTYGTMGDRGVTLQLATYGKMFAITRQAIINDDLGAFTRVPNRMGRAAKRTIGNLVYAQLTGNVVLGDAIALFHASHNNYVTGTPASAPSVDSVDDGRVAMALQTDPDSHATNGLNIRPAFLIVPVELEGIAKTLMASQFDPDGTAGERIPNRVAGTMQVVSDARLSTASSTAWYMAANPNVVDTIEVSYLNGNSTPTMEQRDGWTVDGTEFKVRIDAGVTTLDYRGLYLNDGA